VKFLTKQQAENTAPPAVPFSFRMLIWALV
jgi:hypothetical protein